MIVIETVGDSLTIDDVTGINKVWTSVHKSSDGTKAFITVKNPPMHVEGLVEDYECDGVVFDNMDDLWEWLTENVLLATSGGGGGEVKSVTGDLVDNSDPENPVINMPQVLDTMRLTYTATGDEGNVITLETGIMDEVNPLITLIPSNTNAIMAQLTSGWDYDPVSGEITFEVSFLTPSDVYQYDLLIKR